MADGGAVDCLTRALELLQGHEGLELFPYRCTAGKLSIGYGVNLDDCGITEAAAYFMLNESVQECMTDLSEFGWWSNINAARQSAMIDMRYNLGATGFRKFQKMLAALDKYDYREAARQILDSKAGTSEHRGLRVRYLTISTIMRNGF